MIGKRLPHAFAIGSLSFWLPVVIACGVFGPDWGGLITIFCLTLCLPVSSCFVLEAFTAKWHQPRSRFAAAMLLGIWATGPFWITLANTSTRASGSIWLTAGHTLG
jgi:hypothetical protein